MKKHLNQRGFAVLGIVMVVSTITLVGVVAFRFLDAQDNTEIAKTQTTTKEVVVIKDAKDVESVSEELDTMSAELDGLDAEIDAEFAF